MSKKKSAKAARQQREAAAAARERRKQITTAVIAVLVLVGLLAIAIVPLLTSNTGDQEQESPARQSPAADATEAQVQPPTDTSGLAPDPALAEDRTWTSVISTNLGDITVELDGAAAPQAVANFVTLAQDGFFDGTDCHRLVTQGIFVLQCGDPTGTGTGGPGYNFGPIEAAPADDIYPAGTLAMARRGGDGNSMGSQFFIVYEDSMIPSDIAGGYTVFGHVTEGLSIVEDVASAGTLTGQPDGRPAQSVIVNEVSAS